MRGDGRHQSAEALAAPGPGSAKALGLWMCTALVPYLFCALAEFMIYIKDGRTIAGQHLRRTVVLATVAFAYATWAVYGAGQEVVFYGFLLLVLGVPVYVWLKWRAYLLIVNTTVLQGGKT